jgi:hypothetical protein
MPLGFVGDADGVRYRATYFERFPGVWAHGDFIGRDSSQSFNGSACGSVGNTDTFDVIFGSTWAPEHPTLTGWRTDIEADELYRPQQPRR